MAPKTKGKTPASSSRAPTRPPAPPRGNHAQFQLPHGINKHGIVFIDDEQRNRCDELVSRKNSEPKYMDIGLLQTLHLWANMSSLFGVLGWTDYVQLQFPVYKKFVWEFFSSFVIDETREHNSGPCYIRFRLGDVTHEMNLSGFAGLFYLPPEGMVELFHKDYS